MESRGGETPPLHQNMSFANQHANRKTCRFVEGALTRCLTSWLCQRALRYNESCNGSDWPIWELCTMQWTWDMLNEFRDKWRVTRGKRSPKCPFSVISRWLHWENCTRTPAGGSNKEVKHRGVKRGKIPGFLSISHYFMANRACEIYQACFFQ